MSYNYICKRARKWLPGSNLKLWDPQPGMPTSIPGAIRPAPVARDVGAAGPLPALMTRPQSAFPPCRTLLASSRSN